MKSCKVGSVLFISGLNAANVYIPNQYGVFVTVSRVPLIQFSRTSSDVGKRASPSHSVGRVSCLLYCTDHVVIAIEKQIPNPYTALHTFLVAVLSRWAGFAIPL